MEAVEYGVEFTNPAACIIKHTNLWCCNGSNITRCISMPMRPILYPPLVASLR
ncbi:MAG: hypothetical protein ACLRZ2_08055 [Veillonella sp.]